jgi:serine/threonine protein kinase
VPDSQLAELELIYNGEMTSDELKPLVAEDGPAEIGAGTRLGKYEIVSRLAVGGMAEIFLARAVGLPGFQKMVVIKRILPQLANKPDFVEMFLDEARIAAVLQHPNVVQTYDIGVVGGNYFIAMEYLHGEELRSIMRKLHLATRRFPLDQALNIMVALAAGLHYAHERIGFDGNPLNIVHRDVTPRNVIVTYEGNVKLLDFGIARAANRSSETRFGTLKGKIPYMSPEQCRGEALDRRTDVFSLGIMLYEITLGRRLFKGASDFEILKKIVEGTVSPPTEVDPAYDPGLEKIVMRSLAKERDQRYQTAAELQTDLESFIRERQLFVSATAVKTFMTEVFGDKIEAWHTSKNKGLSLEQHLISQGELVIEALADGEEPELGNGEDLVIHTSPAKPLPGPGTASPPRETNALTADDLEELSQPARRARWPFLAGGAAVLAVGGWLLVPKHASAPPPPPRPAEAPIAAPAPPPVAAPPPVPAAAAAAAPDPDPGATGHRSHHSSHSHHGTTPPVAPVVVPEPKVTGEGTLVIATSPWCTVTIDGEGRGPTPVSVKVQAGKHSVVLDNPEFKIHRQLSVVVPPNETVRKKLDFAQ